MPSSSQRDPGDPGAPAKKGGALGSANSFSRTVVPHASGWSASAPKRNSSASSGGAQKHSSAKCSGGWPRSPGQSAAPGSSSSSVNSAAPSSGRRRKIFSTSLQLLLRGAQQSREVGRRKVGTGLE